MTTQTTRPRAAILSRRKVREIQDKLKAMGINSELNEIDAAAHKSAGWASNAFNRARLGRGYHHKTAVKLAQALTDLAGGRLMVAVADVVEAGPGADHAEDRQSPAASRIVHAEAMTADGAPGPGGGA